MSFSPSCRFYLTVVYRIYGRLLLSFLTMKTDNHKGEKCDSKRRWSSPQLRCKAKEKDRMEDISFKNKRKWRIIREEISRITGLLGDPYFPLDEAHVCARRSTKSLQYLMVLRKKLCFLAVCISHVVQENTHIWASLACSFGPTIAQH